MTSASESSQENASVPRFHCPHCGSTAWPIPTRRIPIGAVWLAVVFFASCILTPFFWIPLVAMRELEGHRCATCGIFLDRGPMRF